MYYDLHIHSCLSPCAEDEMTVNNIVNMSLVKDLEVIAICDHNSTKQLKTLQKVSEGKIKVLYGVEIQTIEEVHILGYFSKYEDTIGLQKWLDEKLIKVKNKPKFFGNQYLVDEMDEVCGIEENLLISSVNASIHEVCDTIHRLNGVVVLAHVLHRKNSVMTQLGFIPKDLDYDGIEINFESDKEKLKERNSHLKEDVFWLVNSDAHQLVDIAEPEHQLSEQAIACLWRDCL